MWYNRYFVFQAEDGIRDLVRSRGLGDVYKRQAHGHSKGVVETLKQIKKAFPKLQVIVGNIATADACLLYTSDAADERSSVDLGGRRIIKKKKQTCNEGISITIIKYEVE